MLGGQREADRAERLRLYYVAMTRAIDRLIVSGAIGERPRHADRLGARRSSTASSELVEAHAPFELERGGASFLVRVDRCAGPSPRSSRLDAARRMEERAAARSSRELPAGAPASRAGGCRSSLPVAGAAPPPGRGGSPTRRSPCSSAAPTATTPSGSPGCGSGRGAGRDGGGLAATEIGDAVHRLLELVDLRDPAAARRSSWCASWYPAVTDEELERIAALVAAYCDSELARRVAAARGRRPERPFAFEHDGVLIHGRLDVLHRDGRPGARRRLQDERRSATASRPRSIETDYRLQRLVYALACFRGGAEEVEVVYAFLERPDAVVSDGASRARRAAGARGGALRAIARINAGEFVPTPGEFTCAGCPALDLVCAGMKLPGAPAVREAVVVESYILR